MSESLFIQAEMFIAAPTRHSICQRCGTGGTVVRWHFGEGIRHLREACARCGKYIKWLPQNPENLARLQEGAK